MKKKALKKKNNIYIYIICYYIYIIYILYYYIILYIILYKLGLLPDNPMTYKHTNIYICDTRHAQFAQDITMGDCWELASIWPLQPRYRQARGERWSQSVGAIEPNLGSRWTSANFHSQEIIEVKSELVSTLVPWQKQPYL